MAGLDPVSAHPHPSLELGDPGVVKLEGPCGLVQAAQALLRRGPQLRDRPVLRCFCCRPQNRGSQNLES